MEQEKMSAWKVNRFARTPAGPRAKANPEEEWKTARDVLSLVTDLSIPECKPNHVLIRVNYTGVMYPDAMQLWGLYQSRPEGQWIPCMDSVGQVVTVGEGVTDFKVDDFVIAQQELGALAEFVLTPEMNVWHAPEGVPLKKVANLGRNFFAAMHSLINLGGLNTKMIVFVTGASGGVGTATIALTKAWGATVYAGTSTAAKAQIAEAAGADRVFVYGDAGSKDADFSQVKKEVKTAAAEDGHDEGVDLIVDQVHGYLFHGLLTSIIRPLGKICLVGFTAGQQPIRPGLVLVKQLQIIGSIWAASAAKNPVSHHHLVQTVIDFIGEGKINPVVGHQFQFSEAPRAFELYENNQGQGGTVVSC